jgi:hypothetical protein
LSTALARTACDLTGRVCQPGRLLSTVLEQVAITIILQGTDKGTALKLANARLVGSGDQTAVFEVTLPAISVNKRRSLVAGTTGMRDLDVCQ